MNAEESKLLAALEQNGYRGQAVPLARLGELAAEMARLKANELVDPAFYEASFSRFVYDYGDWLPGAKSIIIAAFPQPIVQLTYRWQGRTRQAMIPPSYAFCREEARLSELVADMLRQQGHLIERVYPPLKLLAVRSGLGLYGRNNICYVEGMGSLVRLMAWVSDMAASGDNWTEARRLPACAHCALCVQACPTKCIDAHRQTIHAERCLTNLNESGAPLPPWVEENWHHTLVGCLRCQTVCPQNRDHLQPVAWGEPLEEDEVALLLTDADAAQLPPALRQKLHRLDMLDYYEEKALSRNLRLLIGRG